ncbi:MAG: hypothetical protein ACOY90_09970 [Candidatus Zhuqueibacterota bacterium]
MRDLIYVPIIHTEADLGSMASSFRQAYTHQFSESHYNAHVTSIDHMWEGLTRTVQELNVIWTSTRLYQDGLPVCGRELEIVTELANSGSKNHLLLRSLIQNGAMLEGTEDKELLLKEYHFIQKIMTAENPFIKRKRSEEYKQHSATLLQQRDRFIANRIDATLQQSETGLLFMGMLHKVDHYLAKDIHVNFLIHRLPFDKMVKV